MYGGVVAAYAVVFTLWQLEPVPWDVHISSVVLWAVCLYPFGKWYAQRKRELPMFELICVAYGLQFSNPMYLQINRIIIKGQELILPWDGVLKTVLLTTVGVVFLILGYYGVQRRRWAEALPQVDLPISSSHRMFCIWVTLIIGLMGLVLQTRGAPIGEGAKAMMGVIVNQFRVGIILLAYVVYASRARSVTNPLLLYASVVAGVGLGLITGMLENAFVPLALIIAVRWHAKRDLPVALLAMGFLGFLVFNAVKSDYREQAWRGRGELSMAERLALWMDLSGDILDETARGDVLENIDAVFRQSMKRMDLLHKFVYVFELTPEVVPYYQGKTYGYMLVAPIPRFMWPNKPSASEANAQMDADYGFLYEQQTSKATIAIGQLPEAYANFGLLGIVVIMLIQGVILGLVNRVFNGSKSDGGRAIYLSLMVFFLNGVGSSTVMWFGGLLQNLLVNALVLRLFSKGFRAKPPAQELSLGGPPLGEPVGVSGQRGVGAVVGPRK
jgi:hypothetical protein